MDGDRVGRAARDRKSCWRRLDGFPARIDNNCLNQALVEPPPWRGTGGKRGRWRGRGGLVRNERKTKEHPVRRIARSVVVEHGVSTSPWHGLFRASLTRSPRCHSRHTPGHDYCRYIHSLSFSFRYFSSASSGQRLALAVMDLHPRRPSAATLSLSSTRCTV